MSSSTAELPEPTPPSADIGKRLEAAVGQLDESRAAYFVSCEQYIGKQSERNEALIASSQRAYGSSFHGFLNTVRDDMTGQKFGLNAFIFFAQEDAKRVVQLNTLLGGEKIQPVTIAGNTEENVDAAIAQTGDEETFKVSTIVDIMNAFNSCLARDINVLLEEMDSKEKPRWKTISEAVGWHALDVGKTAIGTFAAVAALQAFNGIMRRRS